MNFMKEKTN